MKPGAHKTKDGLAFSIRWLLPFDIKQAVNINGESDDPWTGAELKKIMEDETTRGWVAVLNNDGCASLHMASVVGFIVCNDDEDDPFIRSVCVTGTHRRQGIGRALLEYASRAMLSLRRPGGVMTGIDEEDIGSLRFFSACGYVAESILVGHYDDVGGGDAYLMRRRLRNEWHITNRISGYYDEGNR